MIQLFISCAVSLVLGALIFGTGFWTCKKFMSIPLIGTKKDNEVDKYKIQEEVRKQLFMDMLGQFDPISPKEVNRNGR